MAHVRGQPNDSQALTKGLEPKSKATLSTPHIPMAMPSAEPLKHVDVVTKYVAGDQKVA